MLPVGSLASIVTAIVVGLRYATLLGRIGFLLGVYGLLLSGALLGRLLSSMRTLAPTIVAACLAVGSDLRSPPSCAPGRRLPAPSASADRPQNLFD